VDATGVSGTIILTNGNVPRIVEKRLVGKSLSGLS
jgi:hypothetical protein